jgi:hypothetical protein
MRFLEKNLEDIIWESDRDLLKERGLCVRGHIKRQLRIGNYGIADLVTFSREYHGFNQSSMEINIYEIKRGVVGISAFLQSVRYARGIRSYLNQRGFKDFNIGITLIGDSVESDGEFTYIEDFLVKEFAKEYAARNKKDEAQCIALAVKGYNNYIDNKWRDVNDNPIIRWKSKLQNSYLSLEKLNDAIDLEEDRFNKSMQWLCSINRMYEDVGYCKRTYESKLSSGVNDDYVPHLKNVLEYKKII